MSRLNARLLLRALEERVTPDTTPHILALSNFHQNWSTPTLITANDNWSGVPSIMGYLGEDTFGEGIDPQTILTPYSTIDVIANQGSNTALTSGGVAEFDGLANPMVALQADGTADAPNLVVFIDTTGRSNISISYTLRDVDVTADNSIQPVALQYRVGNAGNFVNVPAGFRPDVTSGPNLIKNTPYSVTLPSAIDNQAEVQIRIITTNAVGNDEWVGVDDIVVSTKDLAINTLANAGQNLGYSNRAVALDADGDAVVVWSSSQDGSDFGVYAQKLNSSGTKVGSETQINTYTALDQSYPAVAADADGDAFVVWSSESQDGSEFGVYGQLLDSVGTKIGGEFRINTYTATRQNYPSVAVDADGDSVVVWNSFGQDGSDYGIYGQRFNAAGTKVGVEFQINTYTTGRQNHPIVAMDADGDVFVVWRSLGQDGSDYGIYGQRLNAAGAKVGVEFQINTYTTGRQDQSIVAMDADGDAVVVWSSSFRIYGQRFNSVGAKVGGEFPINTDTTNSQSSPSVALDADGDSVVAWYAADGSGGGIFGQRFSSNGAKLGTEFDINSYTTGNQYSPTVAVDADGDTMVVWDSDAGTASGIFGQRFRSPNPAAKISSIQVNDGSAQRSMVTLLKIAFDSKVSFSGGPAAAFSLVNQETSSAATLSAALSASGTFVTLTFTGGSVDLGGSLADGRYTLTINGNQFTGNGFDGNGDGIPGDNYVVIGSPANGLFRLFGDADGDGTVAANDFIQLRLANPSLIFDFDNDGAVAASDVTQFRLRFGGSV